MLKQAVFFSTFFLLFLCGSAQVNFNSDDRRFIEYYGGQNQPVYYSFKEALAKSKHVVKLSCKDQYMGNKVNKFAKFVNVQVMVLENNGIADLPAEMGMMKNLFIFSSKRNKIIYIDPAISSCSSLLYMELYNTKLDSLPKSMQHLRSLELLRIGNNESDTLRIPEELTYLRGLRDLQLFDCNLYRLPINMQNFDAMERLVCNNCQLDSLPASLGYMPRLKHLELNNNRILVLPSSISKLKNLEYLSLRNNKLSDLPESLIWLTKLQTLDIRGNLISVQTLEILRLSLPNCRIIKDSPPPKK